MKTNAQTLHTHRGNELLDEERCVPPSKQAVGAVRVPQLRCEHAEQNDAEEAADAVHAPNVERVVPAQPVLERDRVVTDQPGADADDRRPSSVKRSLRRA